MLMFMQKEAANVNDIRRLKYMVNTGGGSQYSKRRNKTEVAEEVLQTTEGLMYLYPCLHQLMWSKRKHGWHTGTHPTFLRSCLGMSLAGLV